VPLTPLIVTVADPVVAVAEAVKVSVLVPVAGLGLKAAVTPVGKVEATALRVTLPVNPPTGPTVTVLVPVPPCNTVAFVADRVKSG